MLMLRSMAIGRRLRPGQGSRLPAALLVADCDVRMDVTGASAAGTGMSRRDATTRWPVTAEVKDGPPERRRDRKRFAQGFLLGVAVTAIAELAVLAVFGQGPRPAADEQAATLRPQPAPPQSMPPAPEILPGLGRLAQQAAVPATEPAIAAAPEAGPAAAAPAAPTMPPAPPAADAAPLPEPAGETASGSALASGSESMAGSGAIAPPSSVSPSVAPPAPRALPMPAEKPAAPQPPAKRPTAPHGSVARMRLAQRMQGLEPGPAVALPVRLGRTIYFFTELKGLAGRPISHRWRWEGRVVQERAVWPASPAWRAYTAKAIDRPGAWQVAVIDTATGAVLAEQRFDAK